MNTPQAQAPPIPVLPGAMMPLRDWPGVALGLLQHHPTIARIVMAEVKGSAPREAGVCMLVTSQGEFGTIGGGQLEWQALRMARALLDEPQHRGAQLQRFVLGGDIGQCCGGVVELWIERYDRRDVHWLAQARTTAARGAAVLVSVLTRAGVARRVVCDAGDDDELRTLLQRRERAVPRLRRSHADHAAGTEMLERVDDSWLPLWLFGAGNVGQALVRILAQLPVQVTWVDSRPNLFPALVDEQTRMLTTSDPVASVATAPPGSWYAIMTHSHALDYSLCRAILTRGDFAWVGLIGSHSKAARFRSRLSRHGVADERIAQLVCPIGVGGIESKWPAAIAVAIAAQLLQLPGGAPESREPHRTSAPAADACAPGDCESCGAPKC